MSQTDDTRDDELEADAANAPADEAAPNDEAASDDMPTEATEAEVVDAAPESASSSDSSASKGQAEADEPERLYTKSDVNRIEAEGQERLLRVMAEYDNFRRRTVREKAKWSAEALETFVKDLLPVFDSFDKARTIETEDVEQMREGLEIVQKQLRGVLSRHEIEVLDPVGDEFDPEIHEALMRQPSSEHAAGTVLTVFERGYKLGARLLRPARTVVADEE